MDAGDGRRGLGGVASNGIQVAAPVPPRGQRRLAGPQQPSASKSAPDQRRPGGDPARAATAAEVGSPSAGPLDRLPALDLLRDLAPPRGSPARLVGSADRPGGASV